MIIFGREEHTPGRGATCHDSSCADIECYIFSAVLDARVNSSSTSYPYCFSTLTITPGRLNTSETGIDLYPCPEYESLNITCTLTPSNNSGDVRALSLPLQVAGIYFKLCTCTCSNVS